MATKLVFFGNEKLATGIEAKPIIMEALKQAGYEIEDVVSGHQPPKDHYESQIAILAAHGRILKPDLLSRFPLGIINVHPSLLPHYRGPTPIEQAILDGASQTGVSIMQVTQAMDSGPVYAQAKVDLDGAETKQELADRLQKLGAERLVQVLPGIIDGALRPKPQQGEPTYCKKIEKSHGQIDWTKSAAQIEREIRAYAGWPSSYTKLGGKDVIIIAAHAVPTNDPQKRPGAAEAVTDGIITVECGLGYLCIDRLKPAGKREMTAKEFLAGHKL